MLHRMWKLDDYAKFKSAGAQSPCPDGSITVIFFNSNVFVLINLKVYVPSMHVLSSCEGNNTSSISFMAPVHPQFLREHCPMIIPKHQTHDGGEINLSIQVCLIR